MVTVLWHRVISPLPSILAYAATWWCWRLAALLVETWCHSRSTKLHQPIDTYFSREIAGACYILWRICGRETLTCIYRTWLNSVNITGFLEIKSYPQRRLQRLTMRQVVLFFHLTRSSRQFAAFEELRIASDGALSLARCRSRYPNGHEGGGNSWDRLSVVGEKSWQAWFCAIDGAHSESCVLRNVVVKMVRLQGRVNHSVRYVVRNWWMWNELEWMRWSGYENMRWGRDVQMMR